MWSRGAFGVRVDDTESVAEGFPRAVHRLQPAELDVRELSYDLQLLTPELRLPPHQFQEYIASILLPDWHSGTSKRERLAPT